MVLSFTPWTFPFYPFPRSPSSHSAAYHTKAPSQNLAWRYKAHFFYWALGLIEPPCNLYHPSWYAEFRPCTICCHQIQQINYSSPYTISIIWRASLFALGKALWGHCSSRMWALLSASPWPFLMSGEYPPSSMVLNQGKFVPQVTFNNGDTLDHYNLRDCYWHLLSRGQGCC